MINRLILNELQNWSNRAGRKPLILRGARQVGKTTAVRIFGAQFDCFIELNLEKDTDRDLFGRYHESKALLEALYFVKKIPATVSGRVLLFIDEIQKSPEAVAMLRYLYEEHSDIYVIAAGSLLETMLDTHISFPVGRCEFLLMHPLSFEEFLLALGEDRALEAYRTVPVPVFAHNVLASLFRTYLLVGGMPEAVRVYAESRNLLSVDRVHESLIISYREDVENYSPSRPLVPIIRHVISTAFNHASARITYEGFGNSTWQSKDVKNVFSILQKAFLLQVVHPVTSVELPFSPNIKVSPRLQLLDTGLVVFMAGMREALFSSADISAVFSGRILEHAVGQELYAQSSSPLHALNFWVREKSQSTAEVDYVLAIDGMVIPVEVKSGPVGRLRSLHSFMDFARHGIAVRLYNGEFAVSSVQTIQKKPFTLVSIPWYHASKIQEYVREKIG